MARPVTEGALMAALSFLLFFAGIIPVLGAFGMLLCPLPLIVMVLRHGTRRALQSMACATALVAMLGGGPVQAYGYLVSSGLVGVLTGWMLTRQTTPARALAQAVLVLALALAPSAVILERSMGAEGKYGEFEKKLFDHFSSQLLSNATTPQQQVIAHQQIQFMRDMMATFVVFPVGAYVMLSLISLYLNHFVAWRVLPMLAMPVRPPPDVRNLRAPEWTAALLMVLLLLLARSPWKTVPAALAVNLLSLTALMLWLSGVAAAARMFSPGYPLPPGRFAMLGFFCAFLGGIPALFALAESLMVPPAPPDAPKPLPEPDKAL